MISYIAKIFNFSALAVQNIIVTASLLGQAIVTIISGISLLIYNIIKGFAIFLQILYEDNITIFTEDLPNVFNTATETVNNQLMFIQTITNGFLFDLNKKVQAIVTSVHWSINTIINGVLQIIILVVDGIMFIGDAIWLIVTFIPIQVPKLLKIVFKIVADIIVEAIIDVYYILLKISNQMSEVPVQSFMGIASAILITRFCVHFRDTISNYLILSYWYLIRNLLYLYYTLYNYMTDSEVRVISQMTGDEARRNVAITASASMDEINDGADSLCVICQERLKCVLTLPCRHICLCTECCVRLYGYQRTCPICRTFIYHSVTVYL